MTRDEFLKRLNVEAARSGWVRVTPRMIRRQIDARLMHGPTPIGRKRGQHPDWQWPESNFDQALKIFTLRARGLERTSEIRIHLWLDSAELPFDRPEDFRQLRRDVLREFRRARNAIRRQVSPSFDPRSEKEISAARAESIARHMGEASPMLVPLGFRYSDSTKLALAGPLLFGEHKPIKIDGQPLSIETEMLRVLRQFGFPEEGLSLLPELLTLVGGILNGLGGVPNNSGECGEDVIGDADEAQFELARRIFRVQLKWVSLLPDIFYAVDPVDYRDMPNFQIIPKLMSTRPWGVLIFAQGLVFACRNKEHATAFIESIGEIEKIGATQFVNELSKHSLNEMAHSDPGGNDNA